MLFNDVLWEQKLKINTEGRDESCSDEHHQPYQPTYYAVLEHIASTGIINIMRILEGLSLFFTISCQKQTCIFRIYQSLSLYMKSICMRL